MIEYFFKGKIVLIVGGVKNLGGLIVCDFVVQGVKVIVIYYNSVVIQVDVEVMVVVVQVVGSKVVVLQGDLILVVVMECLFVDVVVVVGCFDIVINMVGKVLKKLLLDISEVEYDEMSVVNVKVVFFFFKEVGCYVNDGGCICIFVILLLGVYMLFYFSYVGIKVLVEYFICVVLKEFGECGILVIVIGFGLMDMLFFYLVESVDVQVYYKIVVVLLVFICIGLIDIVDIVLWICFFVIDGWWMIGQIILVNGGYIIK